MDKAARSVMIAGKGRAKRPHAGRQSPGWEQDMLQGWAVIAVALGYIGLLFLVASYGDRVRRLGRDGRARLLIYPLSLAIYCTSWTFFGSVGSASRTGYEFLTIYIGPVLMIGLFAPMIARVVRLAKAQNITSIADFIAARYGKSQAVAATVALIAIIGTVPYIALQLKAVSFSLETIIAHAMPSADSAIRCSATWRSMWRCRWRCSRCCSAPATSTPPSTRTA